MFFATRNMQEAVFELISLADSSLVTRPVLVEQCIDLVLSTRSGVSLCGDTYQQFS